MSLVARFLAQFHEALGQAYGCSILDGAGIALRRDLGNEEAKELSDALATGMRAAIAKELADVIYVAYGTAYVLGIPIDEVIEEVHASNMRKITRDTLLRVDGKVLKPADWQPADVEAALDRGDDQRLRKINT